MFAELLAQVPVHAQVMEEIVALENPVFLHHPQILGADERLENRRRDIRVIVGAQGVADVV
ncbi:hypothetical protein D3C71_704850 [compost metagenome]